MRGNVIDFRRRTTSRFCPIEGADILPMAGRCSRQRKPLLVAWIEFWFAWTRWMLWL
jgi:hypothetical protein